MRQTVEFTILSLNIVLFCNPHICNWMQDYVHTWPFKAILVIPFLYSDTCTWGGKEDRGITHFAGGQYKDLTGTHICFKLELSFELTRCTCLSQVYWWYNFSVLFSSLSNWYCDTTSPRWVDLGTVIICSELVRIINLVQTLKCYIYCI